MRSLRRIDVSAFQCGNSVLWLSRTSAARATASWSLLLLSSVLFLYVLASSCIAYDVSTLVARPLERMARSLRKMAGTVLFLHTTENAAEERDGVHEEETAVKETKGGAPAPAVRNTIDEETVQPAAAV